LDNKLRVEGRSFRAGDIQYWGTFDGIVMEENRAENFIEYRYHGRWSDGSGELIGYGRMHFKNEPNDPNEYRRAVGHFIEIYKGENVWKDHSETYAVKLSRKEVASVLGDRSF
jgi:hypothetical protein